MLNAVLNFAPGAMAGKILLHGGASPIIRPNSNLIPAVDYTAAFGPGFYTSNLLGTPQKFATRAALRSGQGVISVFDMLDSLYAKTLKISDKPISKQPEVADAISKLVNIDEGARRAIIDTAKFMRQGSGKSADEILTGELVDKALRKYYGGMAPSYEMLASVGIPGRTWQYSAEKPAELATLVFPQYYNSLESLGSFPIGPGMQDLRTGREQLNAIIKQAGK